MMLMTRRDGDRYDSDSRRRYDDGRYMPQGRYMPDEYPVIYPERRGDGPRMGYDHDYGDTRMGFRGTGRDYPIYPQNRAYDFELNGNVVDRDGNRMAGHASGRMMPQHMTREMAEEWTANLHNDNGPPGPHWRYDQATKLMEQQGIHCDPVEFYVTLNMMYSDYSEVAKKMGVNTVDFYACMAKAFLEDKDGPKDKLMRYYQYIAEAK